jgi:hypothetical protein
LLAGRRRLLPDRAGRHLHVLLIQRIHHVGRGQVPAGHARRIEPQPHGVLAFAKNKDITHALHALQRIANVNVQIVADEQAVVLVVIGVEARTEDEAAGAFAYADAGGLDRSGQSALSLVHPVLNVNGSKVNIAVDVESHRDGAGTIVAAGRGHVLHAGNAVDLLLQRDCDAGLHRLRTGAVIVAAHADLRRRQIWKLRDG